MKSLVTFLLPLLSLTGPLAARALLRCPLFMQDAGLDWDRFPGVAAHGTHSMAVEDLRHFEPDVGEVNSVPVVNPDLVSSAPILLHAPTMFHLTSVFVTPAMQMVDRVLSHMDNSFYDVRAYSTLEKLVHGLHMQETWKLAEVEYKALKARPPGSGVCQCMIDVENNNVMKMLRFIALKAREPELMYDHKTISVDGREYTWDHNIYSYGFSPVQSAEKLFEKTPAEEGLLPLVRQRGWAMWKDLMVAGMAMPVDKRLLAVYYLFCSLHKNMPGYSN